MNMTNNNDDESIILSGSFRHPAAYLDEFTYESRGIQKLADQVRDLVEDFLDNDVIDPNFPEHLEDDDLDRYIDERQQKVVIMVCQSLLGYDRVVS